jgi:hypothetical protein
MRRQRERAGHGGDSRHEQVARRGEQALLEAAAVEQQGSDASEVHGEAAEEEWPGHPERKERPIRYQRGGDHEG